MVVENGLTDQEYDRMHETYCANWDRIDTQEQGLLGYRLTCTKADLHQDRDPADVQALRLRRLRKIIHNNQIGMFDPNHNPAIVPQSVKGAGICSTRPTRDHFPKWCLARPHEHRPAGLPGRVSRHNADLMADLLDEKEMG